MYILGYMASFSSRPLDQTVTIVVIVDISFFYDGFCFRRFTTRVVSRSVALVRALEDTGLMGPTGTLRVEYPLAYVAIQSLPAFCI